jgi:phosphoribosylformylglycinamidine cyclo-ligase
MEIYVPEAVAQDIIAISKSFNVDANRSKQPNKPTISSEYGTF